MVLIEVLCLGGVVVASCAELWAQERAARRAVAFPRESLELRCPYCHDPLAERQDVVGCVACASLHHGECFADHGGCSVFGCRARRPGKRSVASPDASVAGG